MCIRDSFHACTVVVKKTVDAFVIAHRIESLVYIRYGVQYDVVLSVQLRIIRAAFLSQCQKGEIVHEPLEHITGIPRFSRLSDVGDFLWSDATLKIAVANLKPTRTIGKGDGKVPLGDKLGFLEATVDFALKRPELRDDFIEFLKTKSDKIER